MLTISHSMVGAAIGSSLAAFPGASVLAFGVGWASHYFLDSVPHWERIYKPFSDPGFNTSTPISMWPRYILAQAVIDVLVATVIIWWLVSASSANISLPLALGAVGAVLPDFLGNVPLWNRVLSRLPILNWEKKFHQNIHISQERQQKSPKLLGLATQIIVVVISLLIVK